jgi:hypothetical protein
VGLSAEQALEITRELLLKCITVTPAAITANFHADPYADGEPWVTDASKWLEGTLDFAASHNIPVWTAEDWLYFWEARYRAKINNIRWSTETRQLTFNIDTEIHDDFEFMLLVPNYHGKLGIGQISVDGIKRDYTLQKVGGISYAGVLINSDKHLVNVTYQ